MEFETQQGLPRTAASFLRGLETDVIVALLKELKSPPDMTISPNLLALAFDPRFKSVETKTLVECLESILRERND